MDIEDEICGGAIEIFDFGESSARIVGYESLGGCVARGEKVMIRSILE